MFWSIWTTAAIERLLLVVLMSDNVDWELKFLHERIIIQNHFIKNILFLRVRERLKIEMCYIVS